LILERTKSFLTTENLGDAERERQVNEAKKVFYASSFNQLFGAGLASPITGGVTSSDPRWSQNSKYDIENGYWAALIKLGIIFTALSLYVFIRSIPINDISVVMITIYAIYFFGSSYQLFAYMDGVFLAIWSLILVSFSNSGNFGMRISPLSLVYWRTIR